jgi:hypothetical protein
MKKLRLRPPHGRQPLGRFRDVDMSTQSGAECRKHNKQIIYTSIVKSKENDPLYPVYVQFERVRASGVNKLS